MTTKETYTEVAIRQKKYGGGFSYITYRDDGTNTPPHGKLTIETAKKQLGLYTKSAESTIVTREVEKTMTDWVELETREYVLLAEALHKAQCHANHVDQCDWTYGSNTYAHKRFEEKAKNMLASSGHTAEELIKIIKLMN